MPWTVYNSDGQILQGSSTLADDAVTTAKIADDAVTYVKMQNLGTADRVLGSASTGVIGEVQIVPDMLATDAVTTVKILDANVTNAKVATGIDAVKLADGSVTNAELQYINSLSSNAQTQISAKQATINSSARLDASVIGANGNVSNTEYGYLSGVTSDIQTQISAAGGAVTREGGNTTEATTTSTSAVDLLSATSLTIAALEAFRIIVGCRNTTGATVNSSCGLKLNATVTGEANSGDANGPLWNASSGNLAASGISNITIAPRLTNYDLGIGGEFQGTATSTRVVQQGLHIYRAVFTSGIPIGEITAVVIRGEVGNSAVTLGSDELHVYSMAAS